MGEPAARAKFAGASMLAIECRQERIDKRLATGYLDRQADSLGYGLQLVLDACREHKAVSVAVLGNAAEIYPQLVAMGVRPDAVTDQTSAHDPLHGYLPLGWTVAEWEERQHSDPVLVMEAARQSMVAQVRAMLDFHAMAIPTFDYGNNIRQEAFNTGLREAFAFPGFVPAYIRDLFCTGKGRSAGSLCPATRRISTRPMPRSRSSCRMTSISITGSTWRVSISAFRACRPASPGSVSAIGTGWDWPSTRWSATAN